MQEIYDKEVFGHLFKYYRKNKQLNREYLTNISRLSNDKLSLSTIRRIEDGGYSSLKAYESLSRHLKLPFNNNEELYKTVYTFAKETYEIINSGKNIEDYIKLRNNIINFKNKNNFIYINEISRLCISTLNLYLTAKLDDSDIVLIFSSFARDLKNENIIATLIYYLLYLHISYYARGTNESINYMSFANKLLNKPLFYLDEIYTNTIKKKKHEFISYYYKDIDNKIHSDDNAIVRYKKLTIKSYYFFILDDYKASKECLLNLVTDNEIKIKLPNRIYLHAYDSLAYIYLTEKDFKKSLDIFKIIIDLNPHLIEIGYANAFMVAEHLKDYSFIEKILKNNKQFLKNKVVVDIFDYYKLKIIDKAPIKDLQIFIVNHFGLNKCNSFQCYSTFKHELSLLVEDNYNYKLFYYFEKENNKIISKYKSSNNIDFFEEYFLNLF